MSDKIKPCKCGYSGALLGINNGSWLSLTCPTCNHSVNAFTAEGLVSAWQQSAAIGQNDNQEPTQ